MDASVLDAIKRWPNVPAVSGWLSLDRHGRWLLHPAGDADQGGRGDAITNAGIIGFINRNYARADDGRWFFQNGPQRVFVRLDAAPLILRIGADGIGLATHTGLPVTAVTAWWLDENGHLYASTGAGPGLVEGRDLPQVFEGMRTPDGDPVLDRIDTLRDDAELPVRYAALAPAPLRMLRSADLEQCLGFKR
jgi:hypothetical protein